MLWGEEIFPPAPWLNRVLSDVVNNMLKAPELGITTVIGGNPNDALSWYRAQGKTPPSQGAFAMRNCTLKDIITVTAWRWEVGSIFSHIPKQQLTKYFQMISETRDKVRVQSVSSAWEGRAALRTTVRNKSWIPVKYQFHLLWNHPITAAHFSCCGN